MSTWRIGRSVRVLRRRRGWRQVDLAARIGVSRQLISRIENDRLDNVPAGCVRACVEALGGYLRVEVLWHGERLSRLLDERHAGLQNAFVELLEREGWTVRVEVSFNEFGDRGRIDVLAFHPSTGTLLVTEVKPDIGDAQDTIGKLDVKARIAPKLVAAWGWRPQRTVPALVIGEGTTPRRHIGHHGALFRAFGLRGRSALAWLRRPRDPASGVLLFLDANRRPHQI